MTRIQFIDFLLKFKTDLKTSKSEWENNNLEDFIEAMANYTKDVQSYYDNKNSKIDADKPTWENFATILKGAAVYE